MTIIGKIVRFYTDGFRSMTVGRTLWLLIIVKIVILFGIIKLFFFPDVVAEKAAGGDKAEVVRTEVLKRVE